MKKEVIVCDGCGKIIERNKEVFHIKVESNKFWNGYDGYDKIIHELDFCEICALHLKQTLDKILKRLENEQKEEGGE